MKQIPETPVNNNTEATSINKPIIKSNLESVMKNQGFSYANMGFKGHGKYWSLPAEYWSYTTSDSLINGYRVSSSANPNYGISPAITNDITYSTENVYDFDDYYNLRNWHPTFRPIRRAKESLEDASFLYSTKQQEITEGWFFVELSAVGDLRTASSNRTGAVKINLTPKVNNDILTAPVYVTELLFEEGPTAEIPNRRFHERVRVIPVYLNYPTDITALQADISYKANTDGDFMVLLYSAIQEAPLVNPSTYESISTYTSYYGDEWIAEPVVNKSWTPGDPLSTAYTRTLSNNDTWNQDGISGGWTFFSTAGDSNVVEENEAFCSLELTTNQRLQTSTNINEMVEGLYMAVSVHLPSSLSANAFIFNGLTSLGVSIIQAVVTTDGSLFLGIDDNGSYSSTDTGVNLNLNAWNDIVVAVVDEQNRKYTGKQVLVYHNHKLVYTDHITRLGDGTTDILRSMSISYSSLPLVDAKVALPHFIYWTEERYPKRFSERDCERLNATFRHMMTGITFDY